MVPNFPLSLLLFLRFQSWNEHWQNLEMHPQLFNPVVVEVMTEPSYKTMLSAYEKVNCRLFNKIVLSLHDRKRNFLILLKTYIA